MPLTDIQNHLFELAASGATTQLNLALNKLSATDKLAALSAVNDRYYTLLITALHHEQLACATLLLQEGADPDQLITQQTVDHVALSMLIAKHGDVTGPRPSILPYVRLLLTGAGSGKKANPNFSLPKSGCTVFHLASAVGDPDLVELFLNFGAKDPQDQTTGETALITLAARIMQGADRAAVLCHEAVMRLLLARESSPINCLHHGGTALTRIAASGNASLCEQLLQRGALANVEDQKVSPLHYSIAGGHQRAFSVLLSHNADPYFVNESGRTPFSVALLVAERFPFFIQQLFNPQDKKATSALCHYLAEHDDPKVLIALGQAAESLYPRILKTAQQKKFGQLIDFIQTAQQQAAAQASASTAPTFETTWAGKQYDKAMSDFFDPCNEQHVKTLCAEPKLAQWYLSRFLDAKKPLATTVATMQGWVQHPTTRALLQTYLKETAVCEARAAKIANAAAARAAKAAKSAAAHQPPPKKTTPNKPPLAPKNKPATTTPQRIKSSTPLTGATAAAASATTPAAPRLSKTERDKMDAKLAKHYKKFNIWEGDSTHSQLLINQALPRLTTHNVNQRLTPAGDTLLHHAASQGDASLCQFLIVDTNANVNVRDARGYTPLHCAKARGESAAANLLRKLGADPAAVNIDNKTPDQLAPTIWSAKNPSLMFQPAAVATAQQAAPAAPPRPRSKSM